MKCRIAVTLAGIAAIVMIAGTVVLPDSARAATVLQAQEQEPALQTMWVVARGRVLVLRLYDTPEVLGKTMATIPAGQTIEVHTDQMYNKYWFKTKEGYYAHSYYLTDVDPAFDPAAERAAMSEEQLQRENELLDKFGDLRWVSLILSHEIQIGMTMEMVTESWGRPDDFNVIQTSMGRDEYTWTYYTPPGDRKRTVVKFDYRKVVIDIATDK